MPLFTSRLGARNPHRIGVIGVRGIGELQGGIERFCSSFYSKLPAEQFDVTLFVRRPDFLGDLPAHIRTCYVKSPRAPALQTIIHSLISVLVAHRLGIRTLHIHGLGACLALPLAAACGMRSIVRHVGPDYHRKQWGRIAKALLRLGELFAARHAETVVCLSPQIAEQFVRVTGRSSHVLVLPNGVDPPPSELPESILRRLGLKKGRYILAVGRIVSDKNFHLLVQAFLRAKLPPDVNLVIAGEIDREASYFHSLLRACAGEDRIVLPGAVYGTELWSLYRYARLFVLPSAHEGMSFSLLEAAISGTKIIASDIHANSHVCRDYAHLVEVGSVTSLTRAINTEWGRLRSDEDVERQIKLCKSRHDWFAVVNSMTPILLPKTRTPNPIERLR